MISARIGNLALAVSAVLLALSCSQANEPPLLYEELLGLIPDTPETRSSVYVNDYALLRDLNDVSLPGTNADVDDLVQYMAEDLCSISKGCRPAQGPFISLFHEYGVFLTENFHHFLAFDVRNVDQSVLAGTPPGMLKVARGRYDPGATERALDACSECPPPLRVEHMGVLFYSWGEDLTWDLRMRFSPPVFDGFGRGRRIAVQDDYVFRTVETPGMKALIEARVGERSSLADVEEFRLLAGGMTDLDAYSVMFTDQTQWAVEMNAGLIAAILGESSSEEAMDRLRQELGLDQPQQNLLRPYQALATGQGKDDNGIYMALVLVHANSKAAEDNVDLLRQRIAETSSLLTNQPWNEMVDSMEIRSEGRVLLARLYGRIAPNWATWFGQRDPLLAHE